MRLGAHARSSRIAIILERLGTDVNGEGDHGCMRGDVVLFHCVYERVDVRPAGLIVSAAIANWWRNARSHRSDVHDSTSLRWDTAGLSSSTPAGNATRVDLFSGTQRHEGSSQSNGGPDDGGTRCR